jgi:hypothetical protein
VYFEVFFEVVVAEELSGGLENCRAVIVNGMNRTEQPAIIVRFALWHDACVSAKAKRAFANRCGQQWPPD